MEQKDIKNIIWSNLDQLRLDRNNSEFHDIKLLEIIGTTLGVEKLDSIFQNAELCTKLINAHSITAPSFVFQFIEELIKTVNKKSIFDPWITVSSPIFFIKEDNFCGFCRSQTEFEIIKSIYEEKSHNIKISDAPIELSKSTQEYDLVLSFPPFGISAKHLDTENVHSDLATNILLKCASHIAHDGKLIFLVSNTFLSNTKGKEALNQLGLFVEAVFAIPLGAFAPITNIPSNLILVCKENRDKTFVAEISQDHSTNKTILQNFK